MLTQIVSQQNLRTRTLSPATNRLGDQSEARLFLLDSDACFIDAIFAILNFSSTGQWMLKATRMLLLPNPSVNANRPKAFASRAVGF